MWLVTIMLESEALEEGGKAQKGAYVFELCWFKYDVVDALGKEHIFQVMEDLELCKNMWNFKS